MTKKAFENVDRDNEGGDEEKDDDVQREVTDKDVDEKMNPKEEEDEEEEEAEEKSKKSVDLTQDDLEKSLSLLTSFVEAGDVPTRKEALLNKAQETTLSKSEQKELFDILGGNTDAKSTLADDVAKSMEPSEDMQKALDVSDFLRETHDEAVKVSMLLADHLQKVDNSIEKSDVRQHEFNLVLAKAVSVIGNLTKAMSERLGVIESQPVRGPKSQTRPLEKSFANSTVGKESLSKSEILNTMSEMIEESCNKGYSGTVDGIDLIMASSKYEQFNQIHPSVLAMVQQKKRTIQ